MDYNSIAVKKHNNMLSAYDASFQDSFSLQQKSLSPSIVDSFFSINEPLTSAPSVVVGDQTDNTALQLANSMETDSTIVSQPASLPVSSISVPFQFPQTATTEVLPARHVCATCSETFSRLASMRRHALKHDLSAQRYDCSFPSCLARGFLRRDKLADHMRNVHL